MHLQIYTKGAISCYIFFCRLWEHFKFKLILFPPRVRQNLYIPSLLYFVHRHLVFIGLQTTTHTTTTQLTLCLI